MLSKVTKVYGETALIKLIAVGLVIGIVLALFVPAVVPVIAVFGKLFVNALKGVAPILVFVLVMNAMSQRSESNATMKPIIQLYVLGTFLASLVAVTASFLFPTTLKLQIDADTTISPPGGIVEVLQNVIMNVVDNPIHALTNHGLSVQTCGRRTSQRLERFGKSSYKGRAMGHPLCAVRHNGFGSRRDSNQRRRRAFRLRETFGGTVGRVLQRSSYHESNHRLHQTRHQSISASFGDA